MDLDWKTRLIHPAKHAPEGYRSLATPVYRGSTTLFPDAESVTDNWKQYEVGYTYGLYGTPTTLELAERICELEKGFRTIITAGGQAAISLIYLALCGSGQHVLIPDSIYGPNRSFAHRILRRFGVEIGYYRPTIGAAVDSLIKENTSLVWCESPGSVTMEVQDVSAIAHVAHRRGKLVVLDNTWAAGVYFDAFGHDVDITMQALTKYIGGHSDLLLGSVTVKDNSIYEKLGHAQQLVGAAASPDDCSLALRGMKTLAVRLKAIEQSALAVAGWLSARPEIETVLHPALPSCPGHDLWERDFTGSSGVFSFVFRTGVTQQQVLSFVNTLKLFGIGFSWGGFASLVMNYDISSIRKNSAYGHRLVRLNIGLEDTSDLLDDLEQALKAAVSN
jgi:cystathionine beta-lyase